MKFGKCIAVVIAIILFTTLGISSIPCTAWAAENENEGKKIEIPMPITKECKYGINVYWGWNLFDRNASEYCHDLSVLGIILSCQAENSKNDLEKILTDDLGFIDPKSIKYDEPWNFDEPAMTFAHKETTINGEKKNIVITVIRGTASLGDINSDLESQADGFFDGGINAYTHLKEYLTNIGISDMNQTILFITGHSYGGAIAQIMAMEAQGIESHREKVFCYTFESPLVQTFNYDTEAYTNVHNIINIQDTITKIPVGKKHLGHEWYYDSEKLPERVRAKMFGDNAFKDFARRHTVIGNLTHRDLFHDHNCVTVLACLINGLPSNMGEGATNRYSLLDVNDGKTVPETELWVDRIDNIA